MATILSFQMANGLHQKKKKIIKEYMCQFWYFYPPVNNPPVIISYLLHWEKDVRRRTWEEDESFFLKVKTAQQVSFDKTRNLKLTHRVLINFSQVSDLCMMCFWSYLDVSHHKCFWRQIKYVCVIQSLYWAVNMGCSTVVHFRGKHFVGLMQTRLWHLW